MVVRGNVRYSHVRSRDREREKDRARERERERERESERVSENLDILKLGSFRFTKLASHLGAVAG